MTYGTFSKEHVGPKIELCSCFFSVQTCCSLPNAFIYGEHHFISHPTFLDRHVVHYTCSDQKIQKLTQTFTLHTRTDSHTLTHTHTEPHTHTTHIHIYIYLPMPLSALFALLFPSVTHLISQRLLPPPSWEPQSQLPSLACPLSLWLSQFNPFPLSPHLSLLVPCASHPQSSWHLVNPSRVAWPFSEPP